jgi:hypothetical protein
LQGFGAVNIYFLQFFPHTFVTHQQIRPILPPCITLIFLPLDTLEDRVQLEELAASRHLWDPLRIRPLNWTSFFH